MFNKNPKSGIQYRVSGIQNPASRIRHSVINGYKQFIFSSAISILQETFNFNLRLSLINFLGKQTLKIKMRKS